MENLAVVSRIFWSCILANLSIVSILFSNGKSNRFFNNLLALDYRETIHSFNLFLNLSIVSILFSNGKSNRSFNNFLAVHFSQSIASFNLVFKWKN